MTALFSPPKMPALQPTPVPPTTDDARQAEEDVMRLRRRRGLASTFLFGRGKPGAASSLTAALGAGTITPGAGGSTGGGGSSGGAPGLQR